MKTFMYHGWRCAIRKGTYAQGGRVRLEIYDADNDEPIAIATVNIPEYRNAMLDTGKAVLIKNWSENDGILDTLREAGFISAPEGVVPTGHVFAHICTLNTEAFQ